MASGEETRPAQYGALCYRCGDAGPEILLVTSRKSGHWIAPKGNLMRDLTPVATAAREAWEEAGVRGRVLDKEVGSYLGCRSGSRREEDVWIHLFPLQVDFIAADFPEESQRRRRWYSQSEAALAVHNPGLAKLLQTFTVPGADALSQAS